jgi:pyruvate,water dikinase
MELAARQVLGFDEISRTDAAQAGGKGAYLAELSRIDGLQVPAGFCVTTHAFDRILAEAPAMDGRLDGLSRLQPGDRQSIRDLSAEIRGAVEDIPIPEDLARAITAEIARLGEHAAYAVRSSATAEDSPTTSFAGQHDTYLNVVGPDAILRDVSRCWASLFTERAVAYRLRNGVDHRAVHMAVVVQRMVFPRAAGVLFTADPITGHRKIASVEASFGLGEALVSGVVNADVYKVRGDEVIDKTIPAKQRVILPAPAGGTSEQAVEPARQVQPELTDSQVVELVRMGRRIEAHFGHPQDVEWCLLDGDLYVVQSRPITTLFPIPAARDDEPHVYVSVGHQQMMTDAMKPLGLSFWQMTTPRPMAEAGGRLFVDVTPILASPASRDGLVAALGKSDPLIGDALRTVLERDDFITPVPDTGPAWTPPGSASAAIQTDPAIVAELIERSEASIAASKHAIRTKSGSALLDFIRADIQEMRRVQFEPRSIQVIMAGMEAAWWLNDKLHTWLGETNVADILTQSVPNNVTSEMGLALLDVADAIRPHRDVVGFLQRADGESFLDELAGIEGGPAARDAIRAWLDKYGMRCTGEIDITRPRWSERPSMLVPLILGHVRNFAPGEGARRFEQGRQLASSKGMELLDRLRGLPDGQQKAEETKQMIDRVRTFAGYREFPKYGMVSRYFVYKQALLGEADRLAQADVIREREDIFYLSFEELEDVVRAQHVDHELIRRRRDTFRWHESLTPPRVLTSDGEMLAGRYRRDDLPAAALIGLPVSAGIAEGRARVIVDMSAADLEAGDILVTAYTDPSWTPLFVTVAGLVTEVGGLMTHGAVIAREYGVPAVVGVPDATRRIRDGQRIRVHGTEGYVEILTVDTFGGQ